MVGTAQLAFAHRVGPYTELPLCNTPVRTTSLERTKVKSDLALLPTEVSGSVILSDFETDPKTGPLQQFLNGCRPDVIPAVQTASL